MLIPRKGFDQELLCGSLPRLLSFYSLKSWLYPAPETKTQSKMWYKILKTWICVKHSIKDNTKLILAWFHPTPPSIFTARGSKGSRALPTSPSLSRNTSNQPQDPPHALAARLLHILTFHAPLHDEWAVGWQATMMAGWIPDLVFGGTMIFASPQMIVTRERDGSSYQLIDATSRSLPQKEQSPHGVPSS